jgi:DNA-binding transcriptional ArsR family regulator
MIDVTRTLQPRRPANVAMKQVTDLSPEEVVELLRKHGYEVQQRGTYWMAQCPAHDDQNPSLKIEQGRNQKAVVHCFANCSQKDILDALNALLHGENQVSVSKKKQPRFEQTLTLGRYATYLGVSEEFLHEQGLQETDSGIAFPFPGCAKVRTGGRSKYIWDPKGTRSEKYPLWPLPRDGVADEVWVTEGETDCLIARFLGFDAYASTSGANASAHVTPAHFGALRDRGASRVVIVPDADESGEKMANVLVPNAQAAGLDARVCNLETVREDPFDPRVYPKDLHEWFREHNNGGGTTALREELAEKIEVRDPHPEVIVLNDFLEAHSVAPEWVIPDLIAKGDVIGVVAPPKSLKTYFVLHAIYCLATRQPLMEQGTYRPERAVQVMLVEEEGNADLFAQRIKRVARAYGDDWTIPPQIRFRTGFTLEDSHQVDMLISALLMTGTEVLVLDPWQRMTGSSDESSSSETQKLWNEIFRIRQFVPGLTIIIIHHARKDATMDQNMVRGSSRFMGEVDTVILLRKEDKDLLGMVVEGRDHGGTEVGEEKLIRVIWEEDYEEVFRLDGNEFTETISVKKAPGGNKNREKVFDFLVTAQDWCTKKQVEEATDLTRDTVSRHLKTLVEDGQVTEDNPGAGHTARYKASDPKA